MEVWDRLYAWAASQPVFVQVAIGILLLIVLLIPVGFAVVFAFAGTTVLGEVVGDHYRALKEAFERRAWTQAGANALDQQTRARASAAFVFLLVVLPLGVVLIVSVLSS